MVDVALKGLSRSVCADGQVSGLGSALDRAGEAAAGVRCCNCSIRFAVSRLLMEQLEYNLLFRWFVGLNVDEPVWVPTRVQ